MNVVIPMAGNGSRFKQAGYHNPKPLIEVHTMPMIELVVRNLGLQAQYIFIIQRSFIELGVDRMLERIAPGCKIIAIDGVTQGAACSVLLAQQYIDNDQPLVIANCDQFMEWNREQCLSHFAAHDAGILTFPAQDPKWSYASLDHQGLVTQVAEKQVISPHATVGVYYWARGCDYVSCAQDMIQRNIRVNNEFYVCPVFNMAIERGLRIVTHDVERMWGLGTPEDLEYFLDNYETNSASWPG